MSEPDSCLRITAAAWRNTVKWPFRWVAITASNSSSDMLNSIRSRRIPATATTPSIRPHRSTAVFTMRSPPAMVRDVLGHGHGLAARGLDLLDHRVGDLAGGVLPGQAHPDVGHHDLGALGRARQSTGPADAAASTGDHDRLVVEVPSHVAYCSCLGRLLSLGDCTLGDCTPEGNLTGR